MPFHAMIEPQPEAAGQRGKPRVRMRLEVPGTLSEGLGTTVLIHNLSASGLLMESAFALTVGQSLTLILPEAGEVVATVVWKSDAFVGCRFERPLSKAALSAARLLDPSDTQTEVVGESLHARLRRLRDEQGLSRAELAAQAGISIPSLWAWETGKAVPRPGNLHILADIFGLPKEELVRGHTSASQSENEAHDLQILVEASRKQIAQTAGVKPSHVKIIIEF
jgi:transcriptional regulator with XRE-family HTH domain